MCQKYKYPIDLSEKVCKSNQNDTSSGFYIFLFTYNGYRFLLTICQCFQLHKDDYSFIDTFNAFP